MVLVGTYSLTFFGIVTGPQRWALLSSWHRHDPTWSHWAHYFFKLCFSLQDLRGLRGTMFFEVVLEGFFCGGGFEAAGEEVFNLLSYCYAVVRP